TRAAAAVQEVHAARRRLVVEAEEVTAEPAHVGLRHGEHTVDGEGRVGRHPPDAERDGPVGVTDLGHGQEASAKSFEISSWGNTGIGSCRLPATRTTPCWRSTTWPMKWQSIDSRASAWMTTEA